MEIVCPLTIDAPADLVFCWITRRDRIVQWLPNLMDNRITHDTAGRVGTRLHQVYREKWRRYEIPVEVTAWEPDRRLAIRLQTKKQDTTVDYRIHPHGAGSRLVVETRIRFRGIMKLIAFFSGESIRDRSVRRYEQQLGRLKRLCEAEAAVIA
jgi:uncharacterized protein YndB with AHSA1/START domain